MLWFITITARQSRIPDVMLQTQPPPPALVHNNNSQAAFGYLMRCCNYSLLHMLWFITITVKQPLDT
jgi:hypothetical protein